jgi:transposase-like protein
MQLYKIKLLKGHNARRGEILNGYLGTTDGVCLYTRGEAIKKARMFGGKIEPHGKNYTAVTSQVISLSRKEISTEVLAELHGREIYKDTDISLNESLYLADVFDAILGENDERSLFKRLSFDAAEELYVLRELTFQVTLVMLVD